MVGRTRLPGMGALPLQPQVLVQLPEWRADVRVPIGAMGRIVHSPADLTTKITETELVYQ